MSNTLSAPHLLIRIIYGLACALLCLLFIRGVQAQSTNVDQPTPVTSNQIAGQIVPRDIGDSRLTRHYYVLTGTPGDLVVTVESHNLDGDVDLFQSGTLRPLAKVSMYAGESSPRTSKSIYLRQRETIVLRVEARTPNDDKGDYRISFTGGFEAMTAPAVQPEAEASPEQPAVTNARRDPNTRRVNSVGARLPDPEPTPDETARTTETGAANEKAADATTANSDTSTSGNGTTTTPESVTTARPQRPPSTRNNRRGRGRVTPTAPPETTARNNPASPDANTGEPPPAMAARPTGIEAGAKLIIETRNGVRVERFMNTVRRVTIENGQIVVFMKDGKIARHPMTEVVRMAIEP